jgi:hypothetical protein
MKSRNRRTPAWTAPAAMTKKSSRLFSACQKPDPYFPIIHLAIWQDGGWLGMDDKALLICCVEASLVLVGFDRSTRAWHAGQLLRAGHDHAGVIPFRGIVRAGDYGYQSRLLTGFWQSEGSAWDWQNRIVYLPKSPRWLLAWVLVDERRSAYVNVRHAASSAAELFFSSDAQLLPTDAVETPWLIRPMGISNIDCAVSKSIG